METRDYRRSAGNRLNKFTTVVFADMIGYSALTARNQTATHKMWMDFADNCLQPIGTKYQADLIRLLGDGCLISFEEIKDAVSWCLEVRTTLIENRRKSVQRWPGLAMRFAVHYCEVIYDNGEVYGDGVNITKRLQERAQADGMLVSKTVYEKYEDDDELKFRYLGALTYKNIEAAFPTYEVIFDDAEPLKRDGRILLPSVAVLPFQYMADGEEYRYFADGVIDDIIHSLACLKELHVIARGSTLVFSNLDVDPREVARILSVRYVLLGKIRIIGDRIRVSISFEDAEKGELIFGENSEFYHRELFDVQDKITRNIVARIAPSVRAIELERALRKPPDNFTAYQLTLRALDLMKSLDRDKFQSALGFLEKAMELDSKFVLPIVWSVRWHCINVGQNWCEDRENSVVEATRLATKAIGIDRHNPLALSAYGHVKSYLERDYATALVYFDRAREIGPSHAITWILTSATLTYTGKGEEAVEYAKRGLDLSPNDYELFQFYDFMCLAHYCCENYSEALLWANLSHAENPNYLSNLRQMVACNAAVDDLEQAKKYADILLDKDNTFRVSDYERICPFEAESMRRNFFHHLRSGGLLE